jgi:TM2 domain-containing membrane protein YozV
VARRAILVIFSALAGLIGFGYACIMLKRLAAFICLVLLGLSLSGCTKCGWLWDQPPRSCHSDAPR